MRTRTSIEEDTQACIMTFSGSDDEYEEDSSSEEGGDGPFNMVTETYISAEDYEDYAELVEWSLFRQKVSIETILQKLVPIWSLFVPKSLFFNFLEPNNASNTTQILLSIQTDRQTHSKKDTK